MAEHLTDQELEEYARLSPPGVLLPDSALDGQRSLIRCVEEHLLVCELCRKRLSRTDEYIASIRAALKELQDEEGSKPS